MNGTETRGRRPALRLLALAAGALVFLFPFYYMLIGSLQEDPDSGIGGALPSPGNLTLANYRDINSSIDLINSLVNSTIITIGVLLCTLVLGLLAGYAMAVLQLPRTAGQRSRRSCWCRRSRSSC